MFVAACNRYVDRLASHVQSGDDSSILVKLLAYLLYTAWQGCRVDTIIIGQNPYNPRVCHEISGSALAYNSTGSSPTQSVMNLTDEILDWSIARRCINPASRDMWKDWLQFVLKESHMLARYGVLMMNCMYVSMKSPLNAMSERIDTATFVRDVIMCRC